MKNRNMSDTKLLVAVIDFGSSGAGYAFSFLYQFKNNPTDVHTSIWNKNNSAVTRYIIYFKFIQKKSI